MLRMLYDSFKNINYKVNLGENIMRKECFENLIFTGHIIETGECNGWKNKDCKDNGVIKYRLLLSATKERKLKSFNDEMWHLKT